MGLDWFKVHAKSWLQGSIRTQLTLEQRSVWIDLLALASECKIRDGSLRHGLGQPMSRDYIASILCIPVKLLNETIIICINDKNLEDDKHRIELWEDGTIVIANFERKQGVPEGKRVLPETEQERKLREIRQLSQLTRKYPDYAISEHTETIVDDKGNVIEQAKEHTRKISHEK